MNLQRALPCTKVLLAWLEELAFLGHVMSLGGERLRSDAALIRKQLPAGPQRDGAVLSALVDGFDHDESVQRGFSPDRLIDGDVEKLRQSLNQLLLFEVCVAYERWATEAAKVISIPPPALAQAKKLGAKNLAHALQLADAADCVVAALAKVAPKLNPPGLAPLEPYFRKKIQRSAGLKGTKFRVTIRFRDLLRYHLIIYRAHKELRNCLIHEARVVNGRFEKVRREHDGVVPRDIGLRELPTLIPVHAGDKAVVSLRGTFGLIQVVQRCALIIDGYAN